MSNHPDDDITEQEEDDHHHHHQQQQQQQQQLQQLQHAVGQHPTYDDTYYDVFDEETDNGHVFVFDGDWSQENVPREALSDDEKTARTNYRTSIKTLCNTYSSMEHPVAKSKEEVLQQRIVAPTLVYGGKVSKRSTATDKRAGRLYPETIQPWIDFRGKVKNYTINDDIFSEDEYMKEIFFDSLKKARGDCSNESQEEFCLMTNLKGTLKEAGIVHEVTKNPPECVGQPDFSVLNEKDNITIMCECKSTHNLLLPMTARDCATAYNNAYAYGTATRTQSTEWPAVAHPIGQLLFYMVTNKHPFGALTSGTRTHFIKIQKKEKLGTSSNASNLLLGNQIHGGGGRKDDCLDARCTSSASSGVANANSNKVEKKRKGVAHASSHVVEGKMKARRLNERCTRSASSGVAHAISNKVEGKMKARPLNARRFTRSTSSGVARAISNNDEDDTSFATLDSEIEVCISDAWFVGEANYLRAWAYMHTLHESTSALTTYSNNWIKSTNKPGGGTPMQWINLYGPPDETMGKGGQGESTSPNDPRDSGGKHGGGMSDSSSSRQYSCAMYQDVLEFALFDEIEIVGVLGEGRNGVCFKVKWNGKEYAMKQFDIGRHGNFGFEKEVRAYMLLQNVWGILVPRPIFLSESYPSGIKFLGMQLGRESSNHDDVTKFYAVLHRLEREYGIHHNDADRGRNMIIISDASGVESVVAIDFEDWDAVHFKIDSCASNSIKPDRNQMPQHC